MPAAERGSRVRICMSRELHNPDPMGLLSAVFFAGWEGGIGEDFPGSFLTDRGRIYGIISPAVQVVSGGKLLSLRKKAMSEKMKAVELPVNKNVPAIKAGDTVSVHVKIREGEKERIQEFRGTVIRLRKGGSQTNFTVRRVAAHGIGVERTFPMRSPRLDKVVVQKSAKVRRAQLYFLRKRKGKRARLHEKSDHV